LVDWESSTSAAEVEKKRIKINDSTNPKGTISPKKKENKKAAAGLVDL